MLPNQFKISFRSLWRNKLFSAINVLGLSIGISAALVIYLIVSYDFNFDTFHKDRDRIYRVVSDFSFAGQPFKNSGVTAPLGKAVQEEVSGLEVVAAFHTIGGIKITIPAPGNKQPVQYKRQENNVYADASYFRLISYTWLAGSPDQSLKEPFQAVLTESRARQYFPELSPTAVIGKGLIMNDSIHLTVSGVVKDLDQKTDFTFQTFVSRPSMETAQLRQSGDNEWSNTNSSSQLLIKLQPGISARTIESSIMKVFNSHRKKDPTDNSISLLRLQPLADIHFNPDYDNFNQRIAHKPTLYGLLAVATFLLLLGCINFINLSTANASKRAREIGIRKTLGSSRKQLVLQFLQETFWLTLISTLVSVLLCPYLLRLFGDFIPDGVSLNFKSQPEIPGFLLALILIVTLVAGFYPAMVLSGYKPVTVLKNQATKNGQNTRSAWLRKSLTVVQFVIAQVFIIATLLVSRQIHFSMNKDLGFDKEGIVFFYDNYYDTSINHRLQLAEQIRLMPGVSRVSIGNGPPLSGNSNSTTITFEDNGNKVERNVQIKMIDTGFAPLYKLRLLAGRNLYPSDTAREALINETYLHELGFRDPKQVLNKLLPYGGAKLPIVGVVQDFHQKSVREKINPMLLTSNLRFSHCIQVALEPQRQSGDWKRTIGKIEAAFNKVYPEAEFDNTFFDEYIGNFYKTESNTSSLLKWASGLAIFISCLGLLGLVIYITNQRTKEIGIRKVVGASAIQIILLLSKDFISLVFLAFLIALPIAWWGSHKWLENFEYRTNLTWTLFFSGGLILLVIALITLSIQVVKAALANPVESLRVE